MTKRLISYVLLVSLIFPMIAPAVHAEAPKEKVIIVFKDDIDRKVVANVNGEIDEAFNNISVVAGEVPEAAIPILENDKNVLAVEVDQRVQVNGQVQDWGIKAVNAPASWKSDYTGKDVKVAILDTGIAPHEDLQVAGGVSFTAYTNSYYDDNGHGTHVAGIIGAENNSIGVVGVAPDASLYAVKILEKDGGGYLSNIIAGMDWAVKNNMDIINLSFGAPDHSIALQKAVDHAYQNGTLVIAAAGNSGNDDGSGDTVEYPARYNSVIAVSATDVFGNRGNFSATGNNIEVSAPGVEIVSTFLENRYAVMEGTSMAAPYVAGTLALLKQANPLDTNVQLREKLRQSAVDLGEPGKDTFFGYGLVQTPTILKQETKTVTQDAVASNSSQAGQTNNSIVPESGQTAGDVEQPSIDVVEKEPSNNIEPQTPSSPIMMPFTDVEHHWAKNDIIDIFQKGWMRGVDSVTFGSEQQLTRAQTASILVRALNLEPVEPINGVHTFDDVSLYHWAYRDIEIIKQHGFMNGKGVQHFAPNEPITREEMAVILDRILEISPSTGLDELSFVDIAPSRWSSEAIKNMSQHGIFKGFKDNTFRPTEKMTRAQMASILNRISPMIE